jgi:DNA primase
MAGRIRDDDIALVRERARIDEVVRDYVALKNAGGGSLKGLCPFHEERTPSFHVTPSRGMWYCFGCSEGGDVLTFVQRVDHLSFAESVEKLAAKFGVELRYVDGGAAVSRQQGQRTRLVEAHKIAAQFFAEKLAEPEARIGRDFLLERGFNAEVAGAFGVGYAPKSWDALTNHLRRKGFSDAELLAGGLVSQGNRGVYDRFRGRLIWPIHDLGGDIVGFGARRLHDDDDGPKYLNTPETPLYKKSHVLYGLDRARRDISKQQEAVVVEGYTDVMACHIAGVTTAVATCGTAFGPDHIKVLRRLLMDDDRMKGHVVFTFDGDTAGQKAALRAFNEDQRFVSQTFVAIDQHGMDPCDLRIAHGDEAIRNLIAQRVPLFQFAITSMLQGYDLDTAEGRSAALSETAPVVAQIKDPTMRPEYTRLLAGWLGLDVDLVARQVDAGKRGAPTQAAAPARGTSAEARVEREALKCMLQQPESCERWFTSIESTAFTHPKAQAVFDAIALAGGPSATTTGLAWIDRVLEEAVNDEVRGLIRELTVEPLPAESGQDNRFAVGVLARLLELDAGRRIEDVRGQLQRSEPGSDAHEQRFAELLALEDLRRSLRQAELSELVDSDGDVHAAT